MASLIPSANASGSGSMTLTAPATNSNQTITLPDASGTAMVSGNMPAFSAYNSTATTVVTGANGTQVALQTEVFDTANCFDTSTWKFTPNVAGYYQINGSVSFADAPITASAIQAIIAKNSTDITGMVARSVGSGSSSYSQPTVSSLIYMNGTTDYLCLVAYQNQGTSRATYTGAGNTFFNGALVRTA